MFFYVPFLWVSMAFSEYPIDLKGEWIQACTRIPSESKYKNTHYIAKIGFFDENILMAVVR